MTADASPDAARSTDEIVDVLIIGGRFLFAVRCSGAPGSSARLRFKAAIKSITGDGIGTTFGLMISPFIFASISCCNAS
jgi:hypothetical protein